MDAFEEQSNQGPKSKWIVAGAGAVVAIAIVGGAVWYFAEQPRAPREAGAASATKASLEARFQGATAEPLNGAPAGVRVVPGSGGQMLFGRDGGGMLEYATASDGGWKWNRTGMKVEGAYLAVREPKTGHLFVVQQAPQGPQAATFVAGAKTPPKFAPMGTGPKNVMAFDAAVTEEGRIYLEASLRNDNVWAAIYDGHQWSAWQNVGGNLTDPMAVAANGDRAIMIGRGTDAGMWAVFYDGKAWGNWTRVAGGIVGSPAIVNDGNGTFLAVGGADKTVQLWTADPRFAGWKAISALGDGAETGVTVAAVADSRFLVAGVTGRNTAVVAEVDKDGKHTAWQELGTADHLGGFARRDGVAADLVVSREGRASIATIRPVTTTGATAPTTGGDRTTASEAKKPH